MSRSNRSAWSSIACAAFVTLLAVSGCIGTLRDGGQQTFGDATPLQAEVLHLEFLGTYGCDSCTGPEQLDLILSVAAGPNRSFAVLNRSPPLVRTWDLDANVVSQFGAKGQGPGELRQPIGLALLRDSVFLFDNRGLGSRLVMYAGGGEYVGYALAPSPLPFATSQDFTASPSGSWTLWTGSGQGRQSLRIVRSNTATREADTIPVPQQLLSGVSDPSAPANLAAAIADDGTVVLGYGWSEYRLALILPNGETRFHRRAMPPQPMPQDELDSISAFFERQGREIDRTRLALIPHFVPGALRFDRAKRLWVRTSHGRHNNTTVFDVFTSDFDYLREVTLDPPLLMYHIGSSLLVGASVSEIGVPVVKVWALDSP